MRRSLPLLFLLMTAMLPSCQEVTPLPARLEVGQENLSMDAYAGETVIGFTSTKPWTATVNGAWCEVIPGSGGGGPAPTDLHVLFDDNMSPSERSCIVTIRSGALEKTVTISQGHRKLLVDPADYEVSEHAQTLEISVWEASRSTIEVDEKDRDWIRIIATKAMDMGGATLSIAENISGARKGTIHVRCEGQEGTITVHQAASDIILDDGVLNDHCHYYFDYNHDGCLSVDEALTVKDLSCTVGNTDDLRFFPNLEKLDYRAKQKETLEFAMLPNLKDLSVKGMVTGIELSHNTLLEIITISDTQYLERLGLNSLERLGKLSLTDCSGLTSLVVSGCKSMDKLEVTKCKRLVSIDLSDNTDVASINLMELNALERLTLGEQTSLAEMYAQETYMPGTLDLSGCIALKSLAWHHSQLSGFILPESAALEEIWCSENRLSSLDLRRFTSLTTLFINYEPIDTIILGTHAELKTLHLFETEVTSLSLEGCPNIEYLDIDNNRLTSLNLEGTGKLNTIKCSNNEIRSLDVSSCASLETLYCDGNLLESLDLTDNPVCMLVVCNSNPYLKTVYLIEGHYYIIIYNTGVTTLVYQ